MTKSVADKIEKVQSGRNQPFVIGSPGSTLLGGGKVFATCTDADFSKYQIIGDGDKLKEKGSYGAKDLTLKLLVDVNPVEKSPANDPVTITDDHRVIAAKIILDEGENDQKIVDFKLNDILTECNTVKIS